MTFTNYIPCKNAQNPPQNLRQFAELLKTFTLPFLLFIPTVFENSESLIER